MTKTCRFELRLTPEEKATLSRLASSAGLSIAEFILCKTLGEKLGDKIVSVYQKAK